jgi:hypothetical protein
MLHTDKTKNKNTKQEQESHSEVQKTTELISTMISTKKKGSNLT